MAELKLPRLNRVYLVGRMTKDPEVKQTQTGKSVLNARMAANHPYRDGEGNWQEEVTYIDVVAWQRLAELCGEYLSKGSPVLVEGRLRTRSWETNKGESRSVIEIRADRVQFLDKIGTNKQDTELETIEQEE
jgi:single-strand DNA-binding protein